MEENQIRKSVEELNLEMEENQIRKSVEELNYYQSKNFAKGLVDIALLTANANQLTHAIHLQNESMKILITVLISLSIILQV